MALRHTLRGQVDYDATEPSLLQPLQQVASPAKPRACPRARVGCVLCARCPATAKPSCRSVCVCLLQPSIWGKIRPMDSSGVRLYLSAISPGSHNASLFASGSFDFTLTPPSSSVQHQCHVDPYKHNFAAGLSVRVFGFSVRTRSAGNFVRLDVTKGNTTVFTGRQATFNPRDRFVNSADFMLNESSYIKTQCRFRNARTLSAGVPPSPSRAALAQLVSRVQPCEARCESPHKPA